MDKNSRKQDESARIVKPGVLYLVATPIGNIEDFSLRAIKVLRQVDWILCEDTRQTRKLCKTYEITTPLVSFYAQVERNKASWVIEMLERGQSLALVSDAGTPAIQDPGRVLVHAVRNAGFQVHIVPGPNAVVSALAVSGIPAVPYMFWGFLPRRRGERKSLFDKWRGLSGTHIAFETGLRMVRSLRDLEQSLPHVDVFLVKELTKVHEACIKGKPYALVERLQSNTIETRGEWVVLVYIASADTRMDFQYDSETRELLREIYQDLRKAGVKPREAVRRLARLAGCSANRLYEMLTSQS